MRSLRNTDAPAAARARCEGIEDHSHATVTSRPGATAQTGGRLPDCACQACADLLAECGEHFALYSKKLLIVGWSGAKSPVEMAYCRAHRSEAQQARAAALSARAKGGGFAPRITVTDGETGAGGGSAGITARPTLTAPVVAAPALSAEVSS